MDQSSSISKHELHPRNRHRGAYDFPQLIEGTPELARHVFRNQFDQLSLDFSDPMAVKALNKALLRSFYKVEFWDIPDGYLCPPIPGRADYIHYAADVLADKNGNIPFGKNIKVLDIGVGANCIYPLIGHREYGWTFVGSEIDQRAIRSARSIIEANELSQFISIRKQNSAKSVFKDIIHRDEKFDLTICNPPFHSSMKAAAEGTERKWKNLGKDKKDSELLNFGGKNAELWCEGGEQAFLLQMIRESAEYAGSVKWFTSLVSKKESLAACYKVLERLKPSEVRTIGMKQGQKQSRILAWSWVLK